MRSNNMLLIVGLMALLLSTGCGSQSLTPAKTTSPVETADSVETTSPEEPANPDETPNDTPVPQDEVPTLTAELLHFDTDETASGYFGGALELSANDPAKFVLPHNPAYADLNRQMTLEAWIAPTEVPTLMKAKAPLITKGRDQTTDWEFGLALVGTRIKFYFAGRVGIDFITVYSAPVSPVEMQNLLSRFQHVGVTWDQGTVQFYYNGLPFGVAATIGTPDSSLLEDSAGDILIGRNLQNGSFTGKMDELRISKTIRWTQAFEIPAAPYIAD